MSDSDRSGRACPCGAYLPSEVELIGVQPNGTVTLKFKGIYHVCPPAKPPMPREVAELVRLVEDDEFRPLIHEAIDAVKALYAEGV
jgi:hypothetical protein